MLSRSRPHVRVSRRVTDDWAEDCPALIVSETRYVYAVNKRTGRQIDESGRTASLPDRLDSAGPLGRLVVAGTLGRRHSSGNEGGTEM